MPNGRSEPRRSWERGGGGSAGDGGRVPGGSQRGGRGGAGQVPRTMGPARGGAGQVRGGARSGAERGRSGSAPAASRGVRRVASRARSRALPRRSPRKSCRRRRRILIATPLLPPRSWPRRGAGRCAGRAAPPAHCFPLGVRGGPAGLGRAGGCASVPGGGGAEPCGARGRCHFPAVPAAGGSAGRGDAAPAVSFPGGRPRPASPRGSAAAASPLATAAGGCGAELPAASPRRRPVPFPGAAPLAPALAVVSAGGLRGPSPPVRSDRCLAAGAAAPPHRACLGLRGADGGGRHAGARSLWSPGGAARAPLCLTGSSVGKGKSVARSWWCGYGKCHVIPLKEEEGLK